MISSLFELQLRADGVDAMPRRRDAVDVDVRESARRVGGAAVVSRRCRSTLGEPICVGDVVSKLIEGVYDSLEPLKKDVSSVFANAISYYGRTGLEGRLHEPSDCDDYVQRAQRFDEAWTSVAKTLKNPGREVKSPTPKKT